MPLKVNVKTPPVNVPVVKSTKVPSYAPAGSYYNPSGKLVNKHGQLLNDKGQAVNNKGFLINEKNQRINAQGQRVNNQGHAIDNKERLINKDGHLINTNGKLINDKGKLVDTQDRLVNHAGRLIDPKGHLIDKDGKPVNREGYLIDKYQRPLDKDGKVARNLASAVKGNNEPHPQLLPPALMKKWLDKIPDPAAPPKLTISEVVTRMTDADKMVKAGIISTSPSGASVARDALISSAITGLVSAPINIGAYAGSTAAAEKIKATYLPVPLTPPTPIAKSSIEARTNEPAALEESFYPRINEAQILALTVTNESIALRFGQTGTKTFPDPHWPNDPLGRLLQLENMLDHADAHTLELADKYEVYFKPQPLEEDAAAEGLAGAEARLKKVEERIAAASKAQGLILGAMKALLPASDSKP